jgi:hypothetical protein
MLSIALSVVGFGLLFAAYGVVQYSRKDCSGSCGACTGTCDNTPAQEQP